MTGSVQHSLFPQIAVVISTSIRLPESTSKAPHPHKHTAFFEIGRPFHEASASTGGCPSRDQMGIAPISAPVRTVPRHASSTSAIPTFKTNLQLPASAIRCTNLPSDVTPTSCFE